MRLLPTTVLAALLATSPLAAAAEVTLHAVQFPDRSVDVPFVSSGRAPAAALLEAQVRPEGAQTRVSLSWKRMRPALLFGGDVACYVLWAVTKDGVAENLGEVFVSGESGSATYSTGKKVFGLLMTAEPFPGVTRPADVVVFASGPTKPNRARSEPFPFAGLTPGTRVEQPSLQGLEWRSREALEVAQAKAILATAEKVRADQVSPKAMEEARTFLARAGDAGRGGSRSTVTDYARRSVALASEAIRDTYRKRAADEAARIAAERKAREDALKAAAENEAERRMQTESAMAQLEEMKQRIALDLDQSRQAAAALAAAKAQVEAEKEALRRERDALAARLGGALEKVAATTKTARGMVVNLEGISFDTGKATLKPDTRVTIGKLAGILLMIPELNIRIEGHTDSTGTAATNVKLSADRARAVFALLRDQGIDEGRMAFEGYGSTSPVAPNTTADGRAQNRRVEIIVAEGEIRPAPPAEPPAPGR